MTCLATLLFTVAAWMVADPSNEEEVKKEKEKLSGTWAVTALEVNGKKLPEELLKELRYVFTAEKLTRKRGDKIESEAAYRLDVSRSPKWIDMLGKTDGKDKSVPGLYLLEGDTLTLCFRMDYKKESKVADDPVRPKKLEAAEGTEQVLMTLKRQKP